MDLEMSFAVAEDVMAVVAETVVVYVALMLKVVVTIVAVVAAVVATANKQHVAVRVLKTIVS